MMARICATRTGPRNGIVRRIFQPDCRRAVAIIAALPFGPQLEQHVQLREQRARAHFGHLLEFAQPLLALRGPADRHAGGQYGSRTEDGLMRSITRVEYLTRSL